MPALGKLLRWSAAGASAALVGGLWAAARPRPPCANAVADPPPGLPPGRVVTVPGHGEMFLREAPGPDGQAPTLLLLHGWMFPADLHWFNTISALTEVGRVIAPDHRGHGRGSRPPMPFRLVDVADDVAALVRQLDAGPVVALGYSLGGPVAQLLWQRHPDLVRGLVLCATSDTFNVTLRDRWVWRGMGLLQLGLRLFPRHWLERALLAQAQGRLPLRVTRMISDETPPEVHALLPWMVGEFDRGSAEDIAEAGRELSRYDARGWISTVDVPTAVLISTRDVLVPARNQRAMADRVPDVFVQELPVDHDGLIARPDLVVPAMRKALEAVLADARRDR